MFNIPDAAVPFITLQRTDVRKTVQGFYRAEIQRDYEEIKAYLPKECTAVLDIGAGMAGIDVVLAQHYRTPIDFYLLDKTEVSENRETPDLYSFHEATRYYSSLTVAGEVLTTNEVPAARVHLIETMGAIDKAVQVDLVISLMAWGYHFPIEEYLKDVQRLLKPGGVLILDLRVNRQDEKILTEALGTPMQIGGDYKRKRIMYRKAL